MQSFEKISMLEVFSSKCPEGSIPSRRISELFCVLYRGSYMSAHVLLNLLNELGKRD